MLPPVRPAVPLRVAVLGAGTVGREVVRALLDEDGGALRRGAGTRLALAGVAVRDVGRARAAGIPDALLTDAPAHLVADPGVDVVVELMGGVEPARTLVLAALARGCAVVTANKHLLAHHGPAIEAAARAAGVPLRFEAAVGGGIPVLGPLAGDLAANRMIALRGIVNGTTNFVLTEMVRQGRDYAGALAEAQARGYAEADPTADVEGLDALDKLVILVRLAFGAWLEPERVRNAVPGGRPGITGVTAGDVAAAGRAGLVLRLIAAARRLDVGAIGASVSPTAVARESAFGRCDGVLNRIEIEAEPVGRVAFEGPGAGGGATSSAVLGDLLAVARGEGSTWRDLPEPDGRAGAAQAPSGETFAGPSGAAYPVLA